MRNSGRAAETDFPPGDILVAIDGERHSLMAARWSLRLAAALGRRIVAVHVKDPYLKQFQNEIYAQGRQEYLDYVDACLEETAGEALDAFGRAAEEWEVLWTCKVRQGDPAEEMLEEIREGEYGLLVIGARGSEGSRRKRRGGLAFRVAAEVGDLPTIIVPS